MNLTVRIFQKLNSCRGGRSVRPHLRGQPRVRRLSLISGQCNLLARTLLRGGLDHFSWFYFHIASPVRSIIILNGIFLLGWRVLQVTHRQITMVNRRSVLDCDDIVWPKLTRGEGRSWLSAGLSSYRFLWRFFLVLLQVTLLGRRADIGYFFYFLLVLL